MTSLPVIMGHYTVISQEVASTSVFLDPTQDFDRLLSVFPKNFYPWSQINHCIVVFFVQSVCKIVKGP